MGTMQGPGAGGALRGHLLSGSFTDEDLEAQRRQGTCPKPHSPVHVTPAILGREGVRGRSWVWTRGLFKTRGQPAREASTDRCSPSPQQTNQGMGLGRL